jgi:hypothetical protein
MLKQGFKAKYRVGAAAGLFLAVAAGTPLALQSLASHGFDVPTLGTAQNLLAMLDARSPGERAKGALTATKVKKVAALAPHERALGKIIRPAPTPPAEFVQAITPPAPKEVIPVAAPPVALGDVIPPVAAPPLGGGGGTGIFITPPPGGGTPGSPGSPGSPGTPGTPETPSVPSVPPAVPEPATWLMMLLGFGFVGSAMRRAKAVLPELRAAA